MTTMARIMASRQTGKHGTEALSERLYFDL